MLRWIDIDGDNSIDSAEFGYFMEILAPLYMWRPAIGYSFCLWVDASTFGVIAKHRAGERVLPTRDSVIGRVVQLVDMAAERDNSQSDLVAVPSEAVLEEEEEEDWENRLGFGWARKLVSHRAYEVVVDIVIIISIALLAWETALYKDSKVNGRSDTEVVLSAVGAVLSCLFMVELGVRVCEHGLARFWLYFLNRMDFIIIIINFVVVVLSLGDIISSGPASLFLGIRILRVLRLFLRFPAFVALVSPFSTVSFRTYLGVGLVIIMILSLSSLIGVISFGGDLRFSNTALKNTSYSNSLYYAINFNDFTSALVLNICLLVVNNWHVFMDAVAAASGSASRLYFVVFIIVGPYYIIATLTSLVFDAYMEGKRQRHRREKSLQWVKRALLYGRSDHGVDKKVHGATLIVLPTLIATLLHSSSLSSCHLNIPYTLHHGSRGSEVFSLHIYIYIYIYMYKKTHISE